MGPQVLVVGAGPVGLTMACSLIRLGLAVRIIDKAPQPSETSKALVVWPRTLELLQIAGWSDPFLATGHTATASRIMAGRRTLARIPLDIAGTDFPYALMIPQNATERLLAAELARLGGRVERETELTAFTQEADGVATTLRHADGRTEALRVDWLAGCDGAHSAVRHGLDLPYDGDTLPSTWLLADVHVAGELAADVLIFASPEGALAMFPIEPGRWRIIGDTQEQGRTAPPTLAEMADLTARRGPTGVTLHDPVWLSAFRINERKVKEYRVGRVFLAGDAAHIHSPAGGQGMNTGMQDAFNLAWKLALVTQGAAAPALLDSYSPERSAIGELVLRRAGQMTRMATIRNPILQALRNEAVGLLGHLPVFAHTMAQNLTELDLHYAASPLNGPAASGAAVRPGARLAVPGLPERLRVGKFLVLNGGALPERFSALAVGDRLAGVEGAIHVVRPDGYLAMSATEDAAVHAWLDALCAPGLA